MIRAVTFDFWNTLYADHNFKERLSKRMDYLQKELSRLGYKRTRLEIERAFEITGKKWLQMWGVESRSLKPKDITESILRQIDLNLPSELILNLQNGLAEIVLSAPPVLVEGVANVLKKLSGSYKIGLISDTAATPGSVLRKLMKNDGIEKYFQSFVFSDELESTKPEKINFTKAIEPLGVKFSEAAHIGDMERTDIAGAKSVGMKAILFTGVNNKDVDSTSADLVITSYDGLPEKLRKI